MKTNILLILTVLFTVQLTSAQVLWSENFDNLTLGNIGTDFTGQTPGQGDWYTLSLAYVVPADADNKYFKIVAEPNRGNVLQIISLPSMGTNFIQKRGLDVLWNNRTQGNDVLKLAFDFFTGPSLSNYEVSGIGLSDNNTLNSSNNVITQMTYMPGTRHVFAPGSSSSGYQLNPNTWYTFVFYIDYTNQKSYFLIPSLGAIAEYNHQAPIPLVSSIISSANNVNSTPTHSYKFDNFVVSAVNNVPLSVTNNFISSKFNLFPNPANDVVTITNSENIGVEQIQVFDISGKAVQSHIFNNENQVQLNIENLAPGTYMLHIQTNTGTAMKKLLKQ